MLAQRTATSRRQFLQRGLALASLGLVSGCGLSLTPWSQRPRVYRIGFLGPSTMEQTATYLDAFREGLRELGYVEGENLTFDIRYGDSNEERVRVLARELASADVDVLVTSSTPAVQAMAVQAMKDATSTAPIVFATSGDPVARGFVASLARPGGNITGITQEGGRESTKRLDLLREAFPALSHVGILWNQSVADAFRQAEGAAQVLGLQSMSLEVLDPSGLEAVLGSAISGGVDGLAVQGAQALGGRAAQIVAFAQQHRLPAIYSTYTFGQAGGLLTYAPSFPAQFHRAATYVDKILKGAKPADLPVEQPTRYDFVVSLKAAQAIGLTLPQSILSQATETVQ